MYIHACMWSHKIGIIKDFSQWRDPGTFLNGSKKIELIKDFIYVNVLLIE